MKRYVGAFPGYAMKAVPVKWHPALLIRITEPNEELLPVSEGWDEQIVLRFHDIDKPLEDFVMFNKDMARQIVDVVTSKDWSQVVVHCTAGVSRSPAVALAIAEYYGLEETAGRLGKFPFNKLVFRKMREVLSDLKKVG